ncbi:MAG: hypothetical protein H0Z19_03905 [Archaeoglobus sp.]|uniref:hypothetical protein n=1 Tax=Archaeoglobus sp. TaxID=1872626 RepID=UPI001D7F4E7C|nr:hypothetical protein [Archaeoglobus sp.]MBO8179611.1 hypothetical protein [Archaeoglobus sp.]
MPFSQHTSSPPSTGTMAVAGVYGGVSPVMEEIAIWRSYDFEKKEIAKYLGKITSQGMI